MRECIFVTFDTLKKEVRMQSHNLGPLQDSAGASTATTVAAERKERAKGDEQGRLARYV